MSLHVVSGENCPACGQALETPCGIPRFLSGLGIGRGGRESTWPLGEYSAPDDVAVARIEARFPATFTNEQIGNLIRDAFTCARIAAERHGLK